MVTAHLKNRFKISTRLTGLFELDYGSGVLWVGVFCYFFFLILLKSVLAVALADLGNWHVAINIRDTEKQTRIMLDYISFVHI